jgi:methyl-accepting chemotaxis protein
VKDSTDSTDKAVSALGNIRESVEVDQKRMKTISSSMSAMKNFSDQVGEAMENVALVSEKNNAVVEDVNVSTKEMSTQLKNVSELAKSLENIAQGEQELLSKFTLNESN